MKRTLKRLTLNRETLGRLNDERLVTAVGASGPTCTPTCNTLCFVCPSGSVCYSDCDTCKTC